MLKKTYFKNKKMDDSEDPEQKRGISVTEMEINFDEEEDEELDISGN